MCWKKAAGINSAELGAGHVVRCTETDWGAVEGFELSTV